MAKKSTVTLREVEEACPNLVTFYQACIRNGYYLPPFKCQLISVGYLKAVKDKKVWCPKVEQVRVRGLADPPKKLLVFKAITDALPKDIDIGFDEESVHSVNK